MTDTEVWVVLIRPWLSDKVPKVLGVFETEEEAVEVAEQWRKKSAYLVYVRPTFMLTS